MVPICGSVPRRGTEEPHLSRHPLPLTCRPEAAGRIRAEAPEEVPRQRAQTGMRHSGRLRRSARLETVRAHHFGSLACKPSADRPRGRRTAPRCTTRGIARSRPRCTAWCSSMRPASSPTAMPAPEPRCPGSSRLILTPSTCTRRCMCRCTTASGYMTRPALSDERVQCNAAGQVGRAQAQDAVAAAGK